MLVGKKVPWMAVLCGIDLGEKYRLGRKWLSAF